MKWICSVFLLISFSIYDIICPQAPEHVLGVVFPAVVMDLHRFIHSLWLRLYCEHHPTLVGCQTNISVLGLPRSWVEWTVPPVDFTQLIPGKNNSGAILLPVIFPKPSTKPLVCLSSKVLGQLSAFNLVLFLMSRTRRPKLIRKTFKCVLKRKPRNYNPIQVGKRSF